MSKSFLYPELLENGHEECKCWVWAWGPSDLVAAEQWYKNNIAKKGERFTFDTAFCNYLLVHGHHPRCHHKGESK